MPKLARLLLLAPLLIAATTTSNPDGATYVPTIDRCQNATFAVIDPNAGVSVNILETWDVAVGNLVFTETNGNIQTDTFSEISDTMGVWARATDKLVFTYSGATTITVRLSLWADVAAVMNAAENELTRTELHTGFDDEGSVITTAEARTPAAVVYTWPVATAGVYQYSSASIVDVISSVDAADSVGFFLELAEPGAQLFTLDVHNLLVRIEQVSPECY